jgi:hypothetical protein
VTSRRIKAPPSAADRSRVGPSGRERRKLKRIMKLIPVRFETHSVRASGQIKNLSKEGLFIRSNVLPMAGDPVTMRFEARDGRKLELWGEVRWTTAQMSDHESAHPGFGVLLNQASADYQEFFEDILLG